MVQVMVVVQADPPAGISQGLGVAFRLPRLAGGFPSCAVISMKPSSRVCPAKVIKSELVLVGRALNPIDGRCTRTIWRKEAFGSAHANILNTKLGCFSIDCDPRDIDSAGILPKGDFAGIRRRFNRVHGCHTIVRVLHRDIHLTGAALSRWNIQPAGVPAV